MLPPREKGNPLLPPTHICIYIYIYIAKRFEVRFEPARPPELYANPSHTTPPHPAPPRPTPPHPTPPPPRRNQLKPKWKPRKARGAKKALQ
jgi:hypothetical protein